MNHIRIECICGAFLSPLKAQKDKRNQPQGNSYIPFQRNQRTTLPPTHPHAHTHTHVPSLIDSNTFESIM